MTNLIIATALSALSITYQGDIRSEYIARGKVIEDRPVQSNMLRLKYSLGEYGRVGLWHWDISSLTTIQKAKRDRLLAESQYGIFYGYDYSIADGWTLKNEFMLRWVTFPFYHSPYKGVSDHTNFEYNFFQSLQNPYVIPTWHIRKCTRNANFLYVCAGLMKPIVINEKLKITPAVYMDFGDRDERGKYGPHPKGKKWDEGVMSAMAEISADYKITEHFSAFASLQQYRLLGDELRSAATSKKDQTVFSVGIKATF